MVEGTTTATATCRTPLVSPSHARWWEVHGGTLPHGASWQSGLPATYRGCSTSMLPCEFAERTVYDHVAAVRQPCPTSAEHCTTPPLLVLPRSTLALPWRCCAEATAEWSHAERLKNPNAVSKPGPFLVGDSSFYLKLLREGGLHVRRKPVWRKCVHGPSRGEIPMGWRKPLRLMCTHGHLWCMTDGC